MKYRSEIDGLRAFSVLSVVAFHAFPHLLTGGFIGVDVFFVISGYLITSHIFEKLGRGEFSLTDFYGRRIRRIFPALILVMVCSLALGWFSLFADEYAQLGKHVASGAAFITNFILANESGYFDQAAHAKPMLHLWSLAIEEQFYIIWPVVLWLAWKMKFNLLAITILVAALSFYLNLHYVENNPTETFYWPVGRFWELLSGSILAWLLLHKSDALSHLKLRIDKFLARIISSNKVEGNDSTTSNLMSFVGLLLLAYGVIRINGGLPFPSAWTLIPVLGAVLVIASGPNAWFNRIFLMNPIAVWFGLISYPLYLWHWPILSFLRIFDGSENQISNELIISGIILSIFLSWLTYKFIERPLRFQLPKNKTTPSLLVSLLVTGLIGFAIYTKEGFPDRYGVTPQRGVILFEEYPHPRKNSNCHDVYSDLSGEVWSCLLSKSDLADVAIIGDSHAQQYYQSFAKHLPNKSVLNISMPGCLPFVSDELINKFCSNHDKILSFLKSQKSIKEIYLTGYWSYLAAGFKFGNFEGQRVADDLNDSNVESFVRNGRKVIAELIDSNKHVTIIRDIPDLIFKPMACLNITSDYLSKLRVNTINFDGITVGDSCVIDKKKFTQRNQPFDDLLNIFISDFPSVSVLDPKEILCEDGKCWVFKNGLPLYYDSDHLTIEGTDYVTQYLLKEKK
jgi:peptidoglycan/LPS O-acetylase OafA/YrhL